MTAQRFIKTADELRMQAKHCAKLESLKDKLYELAKEVESVKPLDIDEGLGEVEELVYEAFEGLYSAASKLDETIRETNCD